MDSLILLNLFFNAAVFQQYKLLLVYFAHSLCISVFQVAAQAPLPPPPAQELLLLLAQHTSCLLPAPLQPFTWPQTPSMWAVGKVSFATWACRSTQPVLAATWRPCRAMAAWLKVHMDASRLQGVLWPLVSPLNPFCHRGLPPWLLPVCRAALTLPWLAVAVAAVEEVRWMAMAASSAHSQPLSFSMWCRLEVAPAQLRPLHPAPPLPLPTCSVEATTTCSRAPTTLSPSTTLTICTDTTFPLPLAWLPAPRSPRGGCSAPLLQQGHSLSASTYPMEAWTPCIWSATPPAASKVAALVMDVSMAPLLRCPCTWCRTSEPTSQGSTFLKSLISKANIWTRFGVNFEPVFSPEGLIYWGTEKPFRKGCPLSILFLKILTTRQELQRKEKWLFNYLCINEGQQLDYGTVWQQWNNKLIFNIRRRSSVLWLGRDDQSWMSWCNSNNTFFKLDFWGLKGHLVLLPLCNHTEIFTSLSTCDILV